MTDEKPFVKEQRESSDNGATWSSWSQSQGGSSWTIRETISDVSKNTDSRVNPCLHTRQYWSGHPEPAEAYDPGATWYRQQYRNTAGNTWRVPADSVIDLLSPSPPSSVLRAAMGDEAFSVFSTQVPTEVQLPNFLLDLKEIGGLIPKLQENMARTVAGGYLSYQFGWKPFLGDLKTLGGLTTKVTDRLRWLQQTRGKVTRLAFESEYDLGLPESQIFVSGGTYSATLHRSTGKFRANGKLYHRLTHLGGMEGELRAFSAALGLLNPAAVLWERIPYSFVADWFARTGSLAQRSGEQPFPGDWNVYDITHSWKSISEYLVKTTSTFGLEPHHSGVPVGTLLCERYERGLGLPVSWSPLSNTSPNPQQLALSTALIANFA